MRLEDAFDLVGTCMTMCPDFEAIERDYQNGVDPMEMVSFHILLVQSDASS